MSNFYVKSLKKMFDYQGRTSRKDFWLSKLVDYMIILPVVGLLVLVRESPSLTHLKVPSMILGGGVLLPMLLKSISAKVRRLHDVGVSGWFYFIPLVRLVFLLRDSEPGTNIYGPNPKELEKTKKL